MSELSTPNLKGYSDFLEDLKAQIRVAQVRAALAVNRELILLYWRIGRSILTRQQAEGWGSKVIEHLSRDLKREFPDITGFSLRNLKYMRSLAEAYPDEAIVQQAAAQIPWGHNCVLLDRVKDSQERLWYIQQTLANGWSRNVLTLQIDSQRYQLAGETVPSTSQTSPSHEPTPLPASALGAITNFDRALPPTQSDLARQLIKDPYNFDFLTLGQSVQEREIERALVDRIRDFLLELGVGFAFLGSQYPIVVDDKEYRLDLLFYHVRLHCYVVIDLEAGEFEPEFSGKMNFYIAAVNAQLRSEADQPTIGMILCRSKRKTTVEYALQTVQNPIGVSTYQLSEELPAPLKHSLPSVETLEMELNAVAQSFEEEK
ncbi:MAG TPA: PDDEXK nuclease domain-containing protein, partial [Trichocoleus sp.]